MKILIAADGSDYSKAAIEDCCRMFAGENELEIKIVSVYEIVVPTDVLAGSLQYTEELKTSIEQQTQDLASKAAELVKNYFGQNEVNISTQILSGIPEREIVEEAANWPADLIVVGSHGRSFWGRLTLGSVSDAILHHAPCSVLIARAKKAAE